MDKVVGWAFGERLLPLASHVLCVSGRLSFELVQKAAVAGCPVLVAVGAPSSLAVELAARSRRDAVRLGARRSRDRLLGAVADRRELSTGVLLVGGASERSARRRRLRRSAARRSPSAAWRTLGEVCDEVHRRRQGTRRARVAVSGARRRGGRARAVFGVLAGLRAAAHDTCLVLPVDCAARHARAASRAARRRRGAADRTACPACTRGRCSPSSRQRVAAGELSLRGVNPTVLDVNEAQLLNVNTPTDLIVAAAEALDTFRRGGPVALPDEAAMLDSRATSGRRHSGPRASSGEERCSGRRRRQRRA